MSIQRARAALPVLFGGAAQAYTDKVLSYSPIAYWTLSETSGTAAVCEVNTAQNGTHSGPTLAAVIGPDGVLSAPSYDGVSNRTNIYTATLAGVFDGTEGTALIWVKISDWTDLGTAITLRADTSNDVVIQQDAADNRIRFRYTAGGVSGTNDVDGLSDTGWIAAAITWSVTADEVKAYWNGSQVGSTMTSIGTFTGSLASGSTVIGAVNSGGASPFNGNLAHAQVYDSALSGAAIAALSTV